MQRILLPPVDPDDASHPVGSQTRVGGYVGAIVNDRIYSEGTVGHTTGRDGGRR